MTFYDFLLYNVNPCLSNKIHETSQKGTTNQVTSSSPCLSPMEGNRVDASNTPQRSTSTTSALPLQFSQNWGYRGSPNGLHGFDMFRFSMILTCSCHILPLETALNSLVASLYDSRPGSVSIASLVKKRWSFTLLHHLPQVWLCLTCNRKPLASWENREEAALQYRIAFQLSKKAMKRIQYKTKLSTSKMCTVIWIDHQHLKRKKIVAT